MLDDHLKLWDIDLGKFLRALQRWPANRDGTLVAFAPDGKTVVTVYQDNEVGAYLVRLLDFPPPGACFAHFQVIRATFFQSHSRPTVRWSCREAGIAP